MKPLAIFLPLLFFLCVFADAPVYGGVNEHPQAFIAYWKPFQILPSEDRQVAKAHKIFKRLLYAWEETRIEPTLYVVQSNKGPWAASLDDGSVLMSRKGIDVCLGMSESGGDDRLAFVLAHELSHQRADHLWHRRFFRTIKKNNFLTNGDQLLGKITMKKEEIDNLESKEIQADREGLMLMVLTGFDPYSVADGKNNFFRKWVESIWEGPCGEQKEVCNQARLRMERLKVYLEEAATRTILFELGIQAYIAKDFFKARAFFTSFGRSFSRKEVHNNLGLTYIGEALGYRRNLISLGVNLGPDFTFQFRLAENADLVGQEKVTRGISENLPSIQEITRKIKNRLNLATEAFLKAIRLDPLYKDAYLNLASTYLLLDNAPAAYGIISGQYIRKFGADRVSLVLSGITAYQEGQPKKAETLLKKAVRLGENNIVFPRSNLAAFYKGIGDESRYKDQWKKIAAYAQKRNLEGIFALALKKMGKKRKGNAYIKRTKENLNGYSLGATVTVNQIDAVPPIEVRYGEEKIQVYRLGEGRRMVTNSDNKIISFWQKTGAGQTSKGLTMGDDAKKINRIYRTIAENVVTSQGEYQIVNESGIAFYIQNNAVAGWFLF